jgi:uncharacterized membrane protein YccC
MKGSTMLSTPVVAGIVAGIAGTFVYWQVWKALRDTQQALQLCRQANVGLAEQLADAKIGLDCQSDDIMEMEEELAYLMQSNKLATIEISLLLKQVHDLKEGKFPRKLSLR